MKPYPHLFDPQEIPLCRDCDQLSAEPDRDGLCCECVHARRNVLLAEQHDVDAELSEGRAAA